MLHGCERRYLRLRKECRLTLFKNRILSKYENGDWRRLHNKKFHSMYRSSNIVRIYKFRRLRWACHVATIKEDKSDFRILTGDPTGKRPFARPWRRWKDDIWMDLKETGINTINWVDSTQERDYSIALVNAALNLRVP